MPHWFQYLTFTVLAAGMLFSQSYCVLACETVPRSSNYQSRSMLVYADHPSYRFTTALPSCIPRSNAISCNPQQHKSTDVDAQSAHNRNLLAMLGNSVASSKGGRNRNCSSPAATESLVT